MPLLPYRRITPDVVPAGKIRQSAKTYESGLGSHHRPNEKSPHSFSEEVLFEVVFLSD